MARPTPGDRIVAAFRRLPPRWRERIKRLAGMAGHGRGPLDGWRARRLGAGAKRPELVARHMANLIGSLGWPSLAGREVMEYGSGYLLAEPLAASLFGAGRVDAMDYTALLDRKALRHYAAGADWRPAIALAAGRVGTAAAEAWRGRLESALAAGGHDWHRHLDVHYHAPFDILADPPFGRTYDLIHSRSTLEHVPSNQASAILARLGALVRPGGAMFHYIHLEDHRDFDDPFAFLAQGSDYSASDHDRRGNRLRASDWRAVFSALPGFDWRFLEQSKDAALLPALIAPELRHYSPDDLRVVHFTAIGRRLPQS